jgi:chromosome segregation ATPase
MANSTSHNSDTILVVDQNPPALVANSDALVADETPTQPSSNDDLQRELEKAKREAQALRKRIRDEEAAKQQADEQAKKEQGQYKDLATQYESRVRELEPVAANYTQLSELVAGQIKEQIKNWPAEVMTFYPGDDAPIEARLAWVEKGKVLVEKLQQQAKGAQPGNAPNPRPSQAPAEGNESVYNKLRASGKYGA